MATKKAIGTAAHAAPIAWVHLRGGVGSPEGYTIRWRRGDITACILPGNLVGSYTVADVLATVDVPSLGWVDFAHIRAHGQRWLTTQNERKISR